MPKAAAPKKEKVFSIPYLLTLKDPNAPKKPISSYFIYSAEQRELQKTAKGKKPTFGKQPHLSYNYRRVWKDLRRELEEHGRQRKGGKQ